MPNKKDQFVGCLLGGAIGDALGYTVEFMKKREITNQYGPGGITDLELHPETKQALISDDTQMTLFTADGLLWAHHRMTGRGIGSFTASGMFHSYSRWYYTQEGCWPKGMAGQEEYLLGSLPHEESYTGIHLLDYKELFARRAPGLTCLSALASGEVGEMSRPINNSKGCGGVMRVAPVGLFLHENAKHAFHVAADIAAMTHGHPSGYLAAGAFAAIIADILQGKSLRDSVQTAQTILKNYDGHEETTLAIEQAIYLASSDMDSSNAITQLGEGWVAEEALAIALYCALKELSTKQALILSVNHDGDSDSTGAICGNLLGALHGTTDLPSEWVEHIELKEVIVTLAEALFNVQQAPPQPY